MIDKITENFLKFHKAKSYTIEYVEFTEKTQLQGNQVFICHTHSSVGVPTGYVSDDEIIQENHTAQEQIITQNTGFIDFFGVGASAKGYLITVLESEVEKLQVQTILTTIIKDCPNDSETNQG